MRKVSGARRSELVHQFLGESTALALLSMVLAVVLVQLALPAFNTFTGKTLVLLGGDVWRDVLVLVGIGLVVGVVAGAYPAFVLSAFRPAVVIKGRLAMKRRTWSLRSLMVVVQFTIAMVLMVGTLVIYRQLAYVRTERLGFDKEHVLILPTIWDLRSDFEPLRERLLQNPDVVDVAQSNPIPSRRLSWTRTLTSHDARTGGEHALTGYQVVIDAHFFPTYRIPFVAGRNLTTIHTSDDRLGVVLNERAARLLGWADAADAINQPLDLDGQTRADIVGVVQDFHFESFHQAIVPMVFVIDPPNNRQVSVRIRPNSDIPGVIAFLERQWQRYDPDEPLNYSFLDQRFDDVYRAEQRLGRVFGVFAFLAIAITCLGLFGMATFSVEQRTKEIGVRRVMGARVGQLVLLLSREFTVLVGIAFVVAVPAAYYAMARWLDGFAYHVPLSWWMFAVVGVVAMAVALATVSTQSIKAATANPAKVLRYE